MHDAWLKVVDRVLRPARPRLEVCLRERERHLAAEAPIGEERRRAIARCCADIEAARAAVFAADDGVVTTTMTQLERRWRLLSRPDPDGSLMELWSRVAPAAWVDRKRFRDSDPDARLDALVALAADPEGVEAAESAVRSLAASLVAWGMRIGTRVRWRPFERDSECSIALLGLPLGAAREALAARGIEPVVEARARTLERVVRDAASARFPGRPGLVGDLAHAAFVDPMLHAAAVDARSNPLPSLRAVWSAGYALSAIDARGVTLELPPL